MFEIYNEDCLEGMKHLPDTRIEKAIADKAASLF